MIKNLMLSTALSFNLFKKIKIRKGEEMRKTLLIVSMILLLGVSSANEHNFTEARELMDSGVSCDELTDEQLEEIGDYYMEQMHPGEAHELMDRMMGGEGSESLKQMHINMARRLYCNENVGVMIGYGGMMPMAGMMNGGMMGGAMGSSSLYWDFLNILYVLLVIGLVILVYLWIVKLWKDMKKRK